MGDIRKVNEAFTIFQRKKQTTYLKSISADQGKLAANALVPHNFRNF